MKRDGTNASGSSVLSWRAIDSRDKTRKYRTRQERGAIPFYHCSSLDQQWSRVEKQVNRDTRDTRDTDRDCVSRRSHRQHWLLGTPRNASLFPTETQKWVDGHDLAAPDTISPLSGRLAFSRADPSLPTSSSSMHVHIQKKNAAITALHSSLRQPLLIYKVATRKTLSGCCAGPFLGEDVGFAHAPGLSVNTGSGQGSAAAAAAAAASSLPLVLKGGNQSLHERRR